MDLNYYDVAFLRCQSCMERTHCKKCGTEFDESMEQREDVIGSHIDPEQKTVFLKATSDADEDDILDALEAMGIFV